MQQMWIATCEIRVEPGDLSSGLNLAFSNVVTWGENSEEIRQKIREDLARYKWELIGCERIVLVNHENDYGDELNDLIDQAEANPYAVLLGRFFSYKPD